MTTTKRDLEKSEGICTEWFQERIGSFESDGVAEVSERDLAKLEGRYAQALAAERASLPESVKEALEYIEGEPTENETFEQQRKQDIKRASKALSDLERWQKGEHETK